MSGVVIVYHAMIAMSPVAVTNVSSQLYRHPMISAIKITAIACMSDDSRSEIPSCSMLAVIVIIAAVWPGGSASKVEIGC